MESKEWHSIPSLSMVYKIKIPNEIIKLKWNKAIKHLNIHLIRNIFSSNFVHVGNQNKD